MKPLFLLFTLALGWSCQAASPTFSDFSTFWYSTAGNQVNANNTATTNGAQVFYGNQLFNARVGIGTLSPSTALEVTGNSTVNGDSTVNGNIVTRQIGLGTATLPAVLNISHAVAAPFEFARFSDPGYSNMRLTFGVGLYYTTLDTVQENIPSQAWPMILQPTGGKVGIGTTNPIEVLQVQGNMWATQVFVTTVTGAKQPIGLFGCLHLSGSTNTIQMTNTTTYSRLTNWTSITTNGFIGSTALGFLTNTVAGYYRVTGACTMIGGNGDTLEMEVFFDGAGEEALAAFHTFDSPARIDSFSVSAIVQIPANTGISLRFKNNTDTDAITAWRASLSVGTP